MRIISILSSLTLVGAFVAVAGCSVDEQQQRQPTQTDEVERHAIGKADLYGSCAGDAFDHCGDMSDGNCWCDDLCETFGDCCSDYETACVGDTWQCQSHADCAELVCPKGGFMHQTCEDGACVTPPVTSCPNVECGSNDDCAELVCPLGGFIGQNCEDFECVNPSIFDCPGVECADDDDCPELVCPGGGGFAHATCEQFKCVMPSLEDC